MAGVIPSFITGANAKIKIDDLTMAFAQDVSYSITVGTIPIRSMGRLEVAAHEPVSYMVQGTLTIVRYTKSAGTAQVDLYKLASVDDDANPNTPNVVRSVKTGEKKKLIQGASSNGNSVNRWNSSSAGNIGDQFDPSKILSSLTFDLEIFSKIDNGGSVNSQSIIKIRDCRLTSKSGSLNKRGLMLDQFTFNAILVDNDEDFKVSGSGYSDLSKD
jgi:hypothetical protein